jgi:hypothetical protein
MDMFSGQSYAIVGVICCIFVPLAFPLALLYTLCTDPQRLRRPAIYIGHSLCGIVYLLACGFCIGFVHASSGTPLPKF